MATTKQIKVSADIKNLKQSIKKPIVLIGLMGTGKTHIGKSLAETLDMPFFDSDLVVEEKGGLSINEIFELYGEERFRQSEEKTILELLDKGACIIATGGGAPVNVNILQAIKDKAISIWLDSKVDDIYERIKQTKNRPLLKKDNPKAVLENLLKERTPVYQQADITIHTHHHDPQKTVRNILEVLHNAQQKN